MRFNCQLNKHVFFQLVLLLAYIRLSLGEEQLVTYYWRTEMNFLEKKEHSTPGDNTSRTEKAAY